MNDEPIGTGSTTLDYLKAAHPWLVDLVGKDGSLTRIQLLEMILDAHTEMCSEHMYCPWCGNAYLNSSHDDREQHHKDCYLVKIQDELGLKLQINPRSV